MRPTGSGGAWASAALALLDDVPTSPASRRLESAHAALGTRHILILGQAPGATRGSNQNIEDWRRRRAVSVQLLNKFCNFSRFTD
jgi:hypothetical protein